jgi:hypothetical protein
MARLRSRPLRERLSPRAVREALGSLSGPGAAELRGSYRTGLRLSQDLLNLALILIGVRFALTGAFITVVSSHALLVLLFNLLVTVPAMYRALRRIGWVDGPPIGPSLVVAGVRRAGSALSGALSPDGSSSGRDRSSARSRSARSRSLRSRTRAYLAGLSLPAVRSVLPDRGSSDRL